MRQKGCTCGLGRYDWANPKRHPGWCGVQTGCQKRLSPVSSMVENRSITIWSALRRGVDGPSRSVEGDRPNGLPTP